MAACAGSHFDGAAMILGGQVRGRVAMIELFDDAIFARQDTVPVVHPVIRDGFLLLRQGWERLRPCESLHFSSQCAWRGWKIREAKRIPTESNGTVAQKKCRSKQQNVVFIWLDVP